MLQFYARVVVELELRYVVQRRPFQLPIKDDKMATGDREEFVLPPSKKKKSEVDSKKEGYFYIFTLKPVRVPLVKLNKIVELPRSMSLQESGQYMREEDHRMVTLRLSWEKSQFKFSRDDHGEFVCCYNEAMFIYIYHFEQHRALSDANKYKLFVSSKTFPMPSQRGTPIDVFDLARVLEIDGREESRIHLEQAKGKVLEARVAALEARLLQSTETGTKVAALEAMVLVRVENVKEMEAKVQRSSINPRPEVVLRDFFFDLLVGEPGISVTKECSVDKAYTVFQGRLDLALLPTTKPKDRATAAPSQLISNMVVETGEGEGESAEEGEGENGMCGSVETKRYTQQATQQVLAGCHSLLAAEVVRALTSGSVGDEATAYAFELRRGTNRLHTLNFNFCDNTSSISSFPDAERLCDATALLNYMIAALKKQV